MGCLKIAHNHKAWELALQIIFRNNVQRSLQIFFPRLPPRTSPEMHLHLNMILAGFSRFQQKFDLGFLPVAVLIFQWIPPDVLSEIPLGIFLGSSSEVSHEISQKKISNDSFCSQSTGVFKFLQASNRVFPKSFSLGFFQKLCKNFFQDLSRNFSKDFFYKIPEEFSSDYYFRYLLRNFSVNFKSDFSGTSRDFSSEFPPGILPRIHPNLYSAILAELFSAMILIFCKEVFKKFFCVDFYPRIFFFQKLLLKILVFWNFCSGSLKKSARFFFFISARFPTEFSFFLFCALIAPEKDSKDFFQRNFLKTPWKRFGRSSNFRRSLRRNF